MVNPIGNPAFSYYDYELSGSYYEGLQKYYKIRIIPRRAAEPVFNGYIYIEDGSFNLKQVDLETYGSNSAMPFLDTLRIKQLARQLPAYEKQLPVSQTVSFTGNIFGIKIFGYFIGMYNDIQILEPDAKLPDERTLIEFAPGANKQNESYWDTLRPLSLTSSEKNDYQKRDSIAIRKNSKSYLDSIDRRSNKFKFKNILGSYRFSNTYRGIHLSLIHI